MAKKKKDLDENQEEFQDNGGNEFGDDDENFGLPDVDYEPLDRGAEDKGEEAEEKQAEEKTEKKPPAKKAKPKKQEPDFAFTDTSDSNVDEPETSVEDFNLEYDDVNEPPKDDLGKKEESKSMGPVIVTLAVLVILIGGVLGYIFWYAPMQEQKEYDTAITEGDQALSSGKYDDAIMAYNKAKELRPAESYPNEQINKATTAKNAALQKKQEEAAAAAKAEEERRLAAEAEAAKAKGPQPGTVERLSARTGRYYVVISSSVDGDLAMDFANRTSKKGVGVQVLSPVGNVRYHRVTILSRETFKEAQSEADNLKTEYNNAWVVKY